ncbi:MAG: glycosyltransferase family 4 protein [Bacteroidales bacterium]
MRRYKIGFLTSSDPLDKRKLSGINYHILQAVQQNLGDTELLGPIKSRSILNGFLKRFGKKFNKSYNIDHSIFMAILYARIFNKRLKDKQFDLIIAPRSSTEIAFIKTKIPILYYSDTTFASLYNYYEWFSNFMSISVWEGNFIEKRALRKAHWVVFTSQWAADSAVNDYHTDPSKIHLIPFGANLNEVPSRELVLRQKPFDICKLLFLGVEWERKGGEIAFETFKILKNSGLKTTLTVCGCIPPRHIVDEDMEVIPYINKNNFDEYKKFEQILLQHHFLILPTRAECFGVVFCEASAYGLPSITTDTGGVGGVVVNGINGYRLPLNAQSKTYAEKIMSIWSDFNGKYTPLAVSTRDYFEQTLNWDVFTEKVRSIIERNQI